VNIAYENIGVNEISEETQTWSFSLLARETGVFYRWEIEEGGEGAENRFGRNSVSIGKYWGEGN
jgi:hypothetical protein